MLLFFPSGGCGTLLSTFAQVFSQLILFSVFHYIKIFLNSSINNKCQEALCFQFLISKKDLKEYD